MPYLNKSNEILADRDALKAALGLRKSDRTPSTKLRTRYVEECCTITTVPGEPPIPAEFVLVSLLTALLVVWEVVVFPTLCFVVWHTLVALVRFLHKHYFLSRSEAARYFGQWFWDNL